MRLGAYTACLHDRSLPETLKILQELGLTSAEINAGGFVPAPHLPIGQLLAGPAARQEYLGLFAQAGIAILPSSPRAEMAPSRMIRVWFSRGAAPVPSMTRAWRSATV